MRGRSLPDGHSHACPGWKGSHWKSRTLKAVSTATLEFDEREEEDDFGREYTVPIVIATCERTGVQAWAYGDHPASVKCALAKLTTESCTCGALWHMVVDG